MMERTVPSVRWSTARHLMTSAVGAGAGAGAGAAGAGAAGVGAAGVGAAGVGAAGAGLAGVVGAGLAGAAGAAGAGASSFAQAESNTDATSITTRPTLITSFIQFVFFNFSLLLIIFGPMLKLICC